MYGLTMRGALDVDVADVYNTLLASLSHMQPVLEWQTLPNCTSSFSHVWQRRREFGSRVGPWRQRSDDHVEFLISAGRPRFLFTIFYQLFHVQLIPIPFTLVTHLHLTILGGHNLTIPIFDNATRACARESHIVNNG